MNVPKQAIFSSLTIAPRGNGYSYLPGSVQAAAPKSPVATFGTGQSPTQIGRPVAYPVQHILPPGSAVNSPIVSAPVAYPVAPIANPVGPVARVGTFSGPTYAPPKANPVGVVNHALNGLFR